MPSGHFAFYSQLVFWGMYMLINRTLLLLAIVSTGLSASTAFAAAPGPTGAISKQLNSQSAQAALTPSQRGEMTRQFVRKWGRYVQQVHDIDVRVWSERMVPQFVTVDSDNFRNALKRNTFEGALDTLNGTGHRMSDERIITRLANEQIAKVSGNTKTLGALSNDLVYTPIQPCRILDTRSSAGGAIPANTTRSFISINSSNFSSQGGSATNCGTMGLAATAVAINLTAVTPTNAGYATAFPFGTTQPVAASVNYAAGDIVNNALIVQIPNPLSSFDFSVYSFAQSHYVADIVGYFAPPLATAQECIGVGPSTISIAVGNAVTYAPACPTGYRATTPYCWGGDASGLYSTGSGLNSNSPGGVTFCSWQNTTSTAQTAYSGTTCCRVPGR
jgi:hypothetical protein